MPRQTITLLTIEYRQHTQHTYCYCFAPDRHILRPATYRCPAKPNQHSDDVPGYTLISYDDLHDFDLASQTMALPALTGIA